MLTQSKLNCLVARSDMLLSMNCLYHSSEILLDLNLFFSKIRSIEKIINVPKPLEVEVDIRKKSLYLEWYLVAKDEKFNYLKIEFKGKDSVRLIANYESLNVDIEIEMPLDEDFPDLILAHLKLFKKPIKKKKYK